MTAAPPTLVLARCDECQLRFLPTDSPCPKCGSVRIQPYPVPDAGRVIAATELTATAPGWASPHRLALVEVADGVRLLAVVPGELPGVGDPVRVHLEGAVYRAHPAPPSPVERGEGEFPKTRRRGSSFEPPR